MLDNGMIGLILIFLVAMPFSVTRIIQVMLGKVDRKYILPMGKKWTLIYLLVAFIVLLILGQMTFHVYVHPYAWILTAGILYVIKEFILIFVDGLIGKDYNHKNGFKITVWPRVFLCLIALIFVLIMVFTPSHIPEVFSNDITEQMWNNDPITGYPDDYITMNSSDYVRVVSWSIAGEILQRAYSDEAARLETDKDTLADMTDPTLLNDEFVWVNFPVFEFIKWVGDKAIPFYLYVPNSEPNAVKEYVELGYNRHHMSWGKRVDAIVFNNYAEYTIGQIRNEIDDVGNPYHVVYLTQKDLIFNVYRLEKILIIDAHTGDYTDYDIDDPDIPNWLEVIYPDNYVYQYVTWWAEKHEPWIYRAFNKKGIYTAGDSSARFIKLENGTYWQILLKHQSSNVLAGYVMVNTKSGDVDFYDRSIGNYVSKDTAKTQVEMYFASGEIGFRQLKVHEGYLYPIKIGDEIFERYLFPCYAGLTLKKIAMVDPVDYKQVIVVDSVKEAISSIISGSTNNNMIYGTFTIENIASIENKIVVEINHTIYDVTSEHLSYGNSSDYQYEWEQLNLALNRYLSGRVTNIDVMIINGNIVDVSLTVW